MRLGQLHDVYERPGPFATVYLDTSGETNSEEVWLTAREVLVRQGADEPTLRALDGHLAQRSFAGRGHVLVAERGEVVLSDDLPQPAVGLSEQEAACFAAVPQLMTYLRLRGPRIPHVVAVVDQLGAGLRIVHATSEAETGSVETPPERVAVEIMREAKRVGARAVVLAGDAEQRRLVLDQLDGETRDRVVETEASHDDHDAVDEPLRHRIEETIEALVHSRISESVQEFEQQRGEPAWIVEGLRTTLAELRREQVRTLLWSAPVGPSERMLTIGSRTNDLAIDESGLGAEAVATVPASAAVVRALAGTGAELVLVDPEKVELADGIGGLLGTPGM